MEESIDTALRMVLEIAAHLTNWYDLWLSEGMQPTHRIQGAGQGLASKIKFPSPGF
jgi:hypothetical protein